MDWYVFGVRDWVWYRQLNALGVQIICLSNIHQRCICMILRCRGYMKSISDYKNKLNTVDVPHWKMANHNGELETSWARFWFHVILWRLNCITIQLSSKLMKKNIFSWYLLILCKITNTWLYWYYILILN